MRKLERWRDTQPSIKWEVKCDILNVIELECDIKYVKLRMNNIHEHGITSGHCTVVVITRTVNIDCYTDYHCCISYFRGNCFLWNSEPARLSWTTVIVRYPLR